MTKQPEIKSKPIRLKSHLRPERRPKLKVKEVVKERAAQASLAVAKGTLLG